MLSLMFGRLVQHIIYLCSTQINFLALEMLIQFVCTICKSLLMHITQTHSNIATSSYTCTILTMQTAGTRVAHLLVFCVVFVCFVCLCPVYPRLSVSVDCPFSIALSVSFNVYCSEMYSNQSKVEHIIYIVSRMQFYSILLYLIISKQFNLNYFAYMNS